MWGEGFYIIIICVKTQELNPFSKKVKILSSWRRHLDQASASASKKEYSSQKTQFLFKKN